MGQFKRFELTAEKGSERRKEGQWRQSVVPGADHRERGRGKKIGEKGKKTRRCDPSLEIKIG